MTDINLETTQILNESQDVSQPKKRGRPKKHNDRSEYLKNYHKEKYENNEEFRNKMKEQSSVKYIENKEEIKKCNKQIQEKYRNAYKILKDLFTKDDIPSHYKEQMKQVCAF